MTMTPLFKKLNLGDVRSICVLNAPESFESELETLDGVTIARHVTGGLVFALAFFIKTMTRKPAGAISQVGRQKALGQKKD
jgi:hypothetical protein